MPTLLQNLSHLNIDLLFIEIDLEKPTPSASDKTLVIASTCGNAVTDVMVDGKPVTIEPQGGRS